MPDVRDKQESPKAVSLLYRHFCEFVTFLDVNEWNMEWLMVTDFTSQHIVHYPVAEDVEEILYKNLGSPLGGGRSPRSVGGTLRHLASHVLHVRCDGGGVVVEVEDDTVRSLCCAFQLEVGSAGTYSGVH